MFQTKKKKCYGTDCLLHKVPTNTTLYQNEHQIANY